MNLDEAKGWAKIRDGLLLAADGINEMLDEACRHETSSSKDVDITKIKWTDTPYGKSASEADNKDNKDYEELKAAILKKKEETQGKTYGLNAGKGDNMLFVWVMNEDRNDPKSKVVGLGAKKAQSKGSK